MEYSLLKLKPSLQSLLTPRTGKCVLKGAGSSLYSLLDSSGEGVKGLRVRMLDGLTGKDYEVDRYERYKVHEDVLSIVVLYCLGWFAGPSLAETLIRIQSKACDRLGGAGC